MAQVQREQNGLALGEASDENSPAIDERDGGGAAERAEEMDSDGGTDRRKLRDSVYRLLRHAVSEPATGIDSGFVGQVALILGKEESALSAEDEKTLWLAYQALSRAITPASDESLKLKERIDQELWGEALGRSRQPSTLVRAYRRSFISFISFSRLLWVFGLLFFVLQSYTLFLSHQLNAIEGGRSELASLDDRILVVRQAGTDISDDKPPLSDLLRQRDWARLRHAADYAVLRRICFLWNGLYPFKEVSGDGRAAPETSHDSMLGTSGDAALHTFEHGAKTMLKILNYLLLPTLLGLLGSLAYVIRGILDSFACSSITLTSQRRWETRVYLGGLLGLIVGAVFTPDLKQVDELKFSPMAWAFLVGYSVEFAFSVFDAVIERGRRTMEAVKAQSAQGAAGVRQNPPIPEPLPAEKPAPGV